MVSIITSLFLYFSHQISALHVQQSNLFQVNDSESGKLGTDKRHLEGQSYKIWEDWMDTGSKDKKSSSWITSRVKLVIGKAEVEVVLFHYLDW